jgi:signal transduction histidine kinase
MAKGVGGSAEKVVKKVVEEHGGVPAMESKLGQGSAFHLGFPKIP